MLKGFTSLAFIAVAISLKIKKDKYYTLELLELGRYIIASLLLKMCIDILVFKQQHSILAMEFKSL